jgi:hypothetical protein
MGIAAIQKSTGRPIEWQQSARAGTCRANAIAAGFDPADVEERTLTLVEFQALAAPFEPPPPPKRDTLAELDALRKALIRKLLVTQAEIDAEKT